MMWDSFPAPVRLIHKNKEVLEVNEVALNKGMKTGVLCFAAVGGHEGHKDCKANHAISSNQA